MSFREWKIWLKSLPFSMKWMVILILVRPIVDMFYFLKEVSPVISPLYIIGFLTPFLIGFSLLSKTFPKLIKSIVSDFIFSAWSLIVVFSLLVYLASNLDIGAVGDALRYLTPILLFFYFRHFINSKKNLKGILQTFLYSAYIPAFLLVYELLIGPINAEYLSEGRGGGARIQGAYADIMNYAIYATGAFLVKGYFFFIENKKRSSKLKNLIGLLIVFSFSFMALIAIKQTSTWAVMISLIGLFLILNLGNLKGLLIILLFSPLLLFFAQKTYTSKIEPLVAKEYKVIRGEADIDRSFNGRMTRWKEYFEVWNEMPAEANLFGVLLSGNDKAKVMISGGMHSDYVRVLFLSGIVGLLFYLFFIFTLFKRYFVLSKEDRFLVVGAVVSLLLYSITTNPLLYTPFIYAIIPIFCYAILPKTVLKKKDV